jgi:molecular chaperone GrpE
MAKNESQKDTTTTETEAVIQAVGELVEDEAEIEVNPSIEELTLQLAEAKQKAESNWESLLRKQADYDNLQKRTARDLNNARQFALEKFATELLAVKDSI